jgi:DNA-binding CsgD family transcriptional regulator
VISSNNNIKVFLAAGRFFIRSGMRDVARQAGLDADYIFIKNLNEIHLHHHSQNDFLIIHNRLIEQPKPKTYLELKSVFKGKIAVFGGKANSNDLFDIFISISAEKAELLVSLQTFFGITNHDAPTDNNLLSTRETDILKEVAMGFSNKEIAERLFISINTVITHRKNITEKLGIKSISGLTVYALMNQLIAPEDVNS